MDYRVGRPLSRAGFICIWVLLRSFNLLSIHVLCPRRALGLQQRFPLANLDDIGYAQQTMQTNFPIVRQLRSANPAGTLQRLPIGALKIVDRISLSGLRLPHLPTIAGTKR